MRKWRKSMPSFFFLPNQLHFNCYQLNFCKVARTYKAMIRIVIVGRWSTKTIDTNWIWAPNMWIIFIYLSLSDLMTMNIISWNHLIYQWTMWALRTGGPSLGANGLVTPQLHRMSPENNREFVLQLCKLVELIMSLSRRSLPLLSTGPQLI